MGAGLGSTYNADGPRVIDGSKLINTGGGGGGITTINGDNTAAQTLSVTTLAAATAWNDLGGGAHRLNIRLFDGTAFAGLVPSPGAHAGDATYSLRADGTWSNAGGGTGITSINGDGTAAQSLAVTTLAAPTAWSNPGGGAHTLNIRIFDGTNIGLVPNGSGGVASNYLGGDGAWHALPSGSGITSINGDANPAQSLSVTTLAAATAWSNPGGGAHVLNIRVFDGSANTGLVPATSGGDGNAYLAGDGTFKKITTVTSDFVPAGTAITNGALHNLATVAAPSAGTFLISYMGGVLGVAGNVVDVLITVNGVPLNGSNSAGVFETAGQDTSASGATVTGLAGGDIVSVAVNHHGGAGNTTATDSKVSIVLLRV